MPAGARGGVRFGVMFRQQRTSADEILRLWRSADDAGFDHIWGFDHLFAVGPDPSLPVFDGWTLLGAMAVATRRARIGLMVTGNLYRHPGLLAKIATTVDHLSSGRLEMGLGAAWTREEFEMMGMPFPGPRERIDRLAEACEALKALWTRERATFDGRYYRITDAISEPKPVQRPHPPLWIGGGGPRRTLRVVATHADVWSGQAPDLETLVAGSRALDEHCVAIGRDPASIRRCAQVRWADRSGMDSFTRPTGDLVREADATLRAAERLVAAGFNEIVLMVTATGPEARPVLEVMARHVLPRARSLG